MKLILAALTLLTLSACGSTESRKKGINESEKNLVDQNALDTSSIVIISFDTTYHWIFKNATTAELNITEIGEIEKILTNCLSKYNSEQKMSFSKIIKDHPEHDFKISDFVIQLDKYKRQYVPVINKEGEKEVWVNCFCGTTWGSNGRTEIVEVMDGGNCYFQLKINLAENKYYDFLVNGNA